MPPTLESLITAIPTAEDGHVITENYHNSLRAALVLMASQLGGTAPGPTVPSTATGLAEKSAFALSNVPGATAKSADQTPRATSFITHGLGSVAVAMIIGLEDFGENPGAPNFERTVDRYYAFRDTGISSSAFQVVAEVTKPYDGTFKLFTNVGTLEFFDRIRWWAIKV